MKFLLIKIVLGSLASLVGYVVGWLIGATWAGNYAVDLRFAGQVGYEAGGIIVGVIVAILASSIVVWELGKKKVRQTTLLLGSVVGGILIFITAWKLPYDMMFLSLGSLLLPALGAVVAGEIARSRAKAQ